MIHIRILFFATLRERAGIKSTEMDISKETTVLELKNILIEKYPGLKGTMDSVVIAINREFAFDEAFVPADAEVALFPPVSGG